MQVSQFLEVIIGATFTDKKKGSANRSKLAKAHSQ